MTSKAHQRVIREQKSLDNGEQELFGAWWNDVDTSIDMAELKEISISTANVIIKEYEWLGTMCNAPIKAYGIFWDGNCGGVIVFGSPSPPNVARSVCPSNPESVIQLGRGACVHWAHEHAASKLIAYGLKEVAKAGYRLVIAYSDPDAGEIGTVYQATNWLYCGMTAKRPDYFDSEGKRKVGHFQVDGLTRGDRTRKHRYVMPVGNKREKKAALASLAWEVVSQYPKRGKG